MEITNKDEISSVEFFLILWKRKIVIGAITFFITLTSIIYAFSLPNIYTSNAVLLPANQKESLGSSLGAYSSFAGLAGINLPTGTASVADEAIRRIESYDFFVNYFLPDIKYENLVAAVSWDPNSNLLIYDKNLFNSSTKKFNEGKKASNQIAYKFYRASLEISKDGVNGFILISVDHMSPHIAKYWTDTIIKNINIHMKELERELAINSIEFLEKSLKNTNLSEMQKAISNLVESQIQNLMLTEVVDDYVFKTISSPIVPEEKSGPSIKIITLMGLFIGFIVSIMYALIDFFFIRDKQNNF
tara:strand:+ start:1015 stop:1920 length:906 start_codon:yes stop_codon:yes gene_type:complete